MNVLIVYDSKFGNTAEIAKTIAGSFKRAGNVKVEMAEYVDQADLHQADLLVVGSPTQGGVASPFMRAFLEDLVPGELKGVKVATFDTRVSARFAKIFGFAANRIAKSLQEKGGKLIVPPEGFYVRGKSGPLTQGERLRARHWATQILLGGKYGARH